jgi:hypothetical protein
MHLQAEIMYRRDAYALGGHDRSRLEYLEEVDLEAVDREGGSTAAETLFIG